MPTLLPNIGTSDMCHVRYSKSSEVSVRFRTAAVGAEVGTWITFNDQKRANITETVIINADPVVKDYPSPSQTGWVSHALQTLSDLEAYTRGWNGLDSETPSLLAVTLAKNLVDQCKLVHLKPSRIAASAEGGIAFCFRKDKLFGSVECLNSGEIIGLISDGSGNPHAWEVGKESKSLMEALGSIREHLGRAAA